MWIDDKPPCGFDTKSNESLWVKANPSFGHTLWTYETVERFVRKDFGEGTWQLFDKLYAGAYRADLFRLMVLLRRGGWWSDLDVGPKDHTIPLNLAAIDGLLPRDVSLVIARNLGYSWMVENNFIGAAPGHPVLRLAIDTILENIKRHRRPKGHTHFAMSGPELVGNCVNRCIDPSLSADDLPDQNLALRLGEGTCMNTTIYILHTNWTGAWVTERGPNIASPYTCEKRKEHPKYVAYGPDKVFKPASMSGPPEVAVRILPEA